MESKWFKEKEKLEKLILQEKKSYEEIGRLYNCSGSNIKKVAKRIGIVLDSRRKINPKETFNKKVREIKRYFCLNCGKEFEHLSGYTNKYCCTECEKEYKHSIKYQKIIDGDPSIMRANYSPRHFKEDILKEQGNVCAICGIKPMWNHKELVFILDHIDGHATNNKRDNLRVICPNCDSQLDIYKSKNKCGDRYYYRYGHKKNKEEYKQD